MWAAGLQFEILVGAQASILVFLSLLVMPLRDTSFFRGPNLKDLTGRILQTYHNMSKERQASSFARLSLHVVRFLAVPIYQ